MYSRSQPRAAVPRSRPSSRRPAAAMPARPRGRRRPAAGPRTSRTIVVAGPHQPERPAGGGLRRDMQHHRAVRRAAHPAVADAHHVPHARGAAAWAAAAGSRPRASPGTPSARSRAAPAPSPRRRPVPGRRSGACMSSMLSKTTARPRCRSSSGDAAAGLITAPDGARFPRSTAIPALSCSGASRPRITSESQIGAPARCSTSGRPVTVSASGSSRSRTSRSTASSPPARWKSSIRCRPAGCRSTSSGTPAPVAVEVVEGEVDAEPAGDGEQVHDRVGGPADRRQRDDRVQERAPGQHRARPAAARRPSPPRAGRWRARPPAAGCPAAGVPASPGMVVPSASAMQAIVEAVPIVLQWPRLRIIDDSDAQEGLLRQRAGPDLLATAATRPCRSRAAGRGTCRSASGRRAPPRPAGRPTRRPSAATGMVLSQPPSSTTPSIGLARSISSAAIAAMLRQSIAVGRTSVSPSDTTGRFSGTPPASQTPCLTSAATSFRCALHGRQVRGGVGDRDVRAAVEGVRRQPAAHPGAVDVGVPVVARVPLRAARSRAGGPLLALPDELLVLPRPGRPPWQSLLRHESIRGHRAARRSRCRRRQPGGRARPGRRRRRAGRRVRHRRRVLHRRDGLPAPGSRRLPDAARARVVRDRRRGRDGVDPAWLGRRVTGDTMLGLRPLPPLPRRAPPRLRGPVRDRHPRRLRPARWPSSWRCPVTALHALPDAVDAAAGAAGRAGRQRAARGAGRGPRPGRPAAGARARAPSGCWSRCSRGRRGAEVHLLGATPASWASPAPSASPASGPPRRPPGAALGRRDRRLERARPCPRWPSSWSSPAGGSSTSVWPGAQPDRHPDAGAEGRHRGRHPRRLAGPGRRRSGLRRRRGRPAAAGRRDRRPRRASPACSPAGARPARRPARRSTSTRAGNAAAGGPGPGRLP